MDGQESFDAYVRARGAALFRFAYLLRVDAPPPPSADRSDEVVVALAVRQALARLGPGSGRCWCCTTSRT